MIVTLKAPTPPPDGVTPVALTVPLGSLTVCSHLPFSLIKRSVPSKVPPSVPNYADFHACHCFSGRSNECNGDVTPTDDTS